MAKASINKVDPLDGKYISTSVSKAMARTTMKVTARGRAKGSAPRALRRTGRSADKLSRDTEPAEKDLATASLAPPVDRERTLERALGSQIRKLRRERDLSIMDLAAAADISIGMASKIEHGAISPSLSTVQAVAAALHVPFSSLFASFEEKLDCSFVAKGVGMRIDRRGTKLGHVYELLGAAVGSDVVMEPYLITLEEKAVAYSGFRHTGLELIYMLSGKMLYRHAGRDFVIEPGDTLLFDAAALHGPEAILAAPAIYLSVIVYPDATSGGSAA